MTMDSRPTQKARLRDVAALAGVSVASASQALRGGPASEDTRQKVLEAARQLRYVAHAGARELRQGAPSTVAMWVLNQRDAEELTETNAFFYELIRGAMEELDRAECSFDFRLGTHPASDALLAAAMAGRYRGFIVVPQWDVGGLPLDELDRLGMPCVTVSPEHQAWPSIQVDQAAGIELALTHLAEAGHRSVGYLAGPEHHLDAEQRLHAFYRHASALGLQARKEWVRRTAFSIDIGRDCMHAFLDRRASAGSEFPTAFLAANDYVAAGALSACAEAGVHVPADLSIIGFDDVDVARATAPALTTVRQPLRDVGRIAARTVLLADDRQATVLQPELVKRDSVAPPPSHERA